MADFEQAFSKTMAAEGGYKLTDIKGDCGLQIAEFCYCLLGSVAVFVYTAVKLFVVNCKVFSDLLKCSSEPKGISDNVGSHVIALLFNSCPSAVRRFVITININPVEGVLLRGPAHV